MAVIFSGQYGWLVDHSKSISYSVYDSKYRCDSRLFVIQKYGFTKPFADLLINKCLNNEQKSHESMLEQKEKKRRVDKI